MEKRIRLRNYQRSDLDAIFRLDMICFSEAFRFDRASMRRFAESKRAISLIAEGEDGEVCGFVIVHLGRRGEDWLGYAVTLDVAPAFRRKGVAAGLMREAERRAHEVGARRMELHVFAGNEGAVGFYERMGYHRQGDHRGFYGKPELDALIYRKSLGGD